MLFGNEVRINELASESIRIFERFMGAKFTKGCLTVREVGSMFTTILWVGTDVNVIVECGRLKVADVLNLFNVIEPFMFPTNRTSTATDMEDMKNVIGAFNEPAKEIAFYCVWENKFEMPQEHIHVAGHKGTWYVIDTTVTLKHGKIYLLEHEQYGDETASLIIDSGLNVLVEDVCNGFDDYSEKYMEV